MNNPYQPNTPEHKVHELARTPGLSEEEVLRESGWVQHDGTWLARQLVGQYHRDSLYHAKIAKNPADRSLAFTALLAASVEFGRQSLDDAAGTVTRFLTSFYAVGGKHMYGWAKAWAVEPEAADEDVREAQVLEPSDVEVEL